MGIFTRISDIVNSNINAILDKAEDPEKIVRLMIQEMEDTLVEVRTSAARTIADKKEINRKLGELGQEEDEWQRKAELAVNKGRDDLAKAALAEKAAVVRVRDGLNDQLELLEESLNRLNDDITKLEDKLTDTKARQKTLLARHETANNRLEVRKQLYDNKVDDALMRFEHFEKKMDNIEGRIEAYDLGRGKDLKQEFVELENADEIEEQLENLKQRLGDDNSTQNKAE